MSNTGLPGLMASLGLLPVLDGVIQVGRGVAAAVIGQTYQCYRLDNATNVSISSNMPVIFQPGDVVQFPARLERTTMHVSIENEIYSLLCYEAMCDNRQLVLGDLLFETGYEAMDAGYYTFAQARPTRATLWMRTEFTATLTRPYPHAGAADQQPTTDGAWVALPDSGSIDKSNEEILTLQNGMYSFRSGDTAQPASVQVGMQPIRRMKDGNTLGTPTDMYRVEYLFYCPELPGEQLNELDRFNLGSADRYEISQVFSSEYTGLAGIIAVCEKTGV